MIYIVDIDGTICTNTNGNYEKAEPIMENIETINRLYDAGNTIIYWTARGTVTGINWATVTQKQLDSWGAKCHEVNMGKPNYDMFICDKAITANTFFEENNV